VEQLPDADVLEAFPASRNTRIDLLFVIWPAWQRRARPFTGSRCRRGGEDPVFSITGSASARRIATVRGSGLYVALGEGLCDADLDAVTKPT